MMTSLPHKPSHSEVFLTVAREWNVNEAAISESPMPLFSNLLSNVWFPKQFTN